MKNNYKTHLTTYLFRIGILVILLFPTTDSNTQNNKYIYSDDFKNSELLIPFFDKLYDLEKNKTRKINIVHIGDSHIQADFFTGAIRENFQYVFGNGGYGFCFPYSLAKTNGTNHVAYKSDAEWQNARNLLRTSDIEIGLSGIGLQVDSDNFHIELSTDGQYKFNTIRVLHPNDTPCFRLALTKDSIMNISEKKSQPVIEQKSYYKVKPGETLYRIAHTHSVTMESIKKANNLDSNDIRSGQILLIPINSGQQETSSKASSISMVIKDTLTLKNSRYASEYISETALNKLYILPDQKHKSYNLSGTILENNQAGVIYHSIGVNGAKASDFNRFPLFFEQLSLLSPDLIIISLGTNESFNKVTTLEFILEINKLVKNIRTISSNTPILIMTPPPSLFKKRNLNTIIAEYNKSLLQINDCIIWDLHKKLGGISAPTDKNNKILIAKDKIHYTKNGYIRQGDMFSSDFISMYKNYIKNNKQ